MKCYHCNQNITDEVKGEVEGKEQSFCCTGCLTVCKIIKDNNLDDFYQQRTSNSKPIFTNQYPLEYYDLDDFKDEFIVDNRITLVSPYIHCAACVWLIEKSLSEMDEVVSVRGNLSNQRIVITLQQDAKFSKVIQRLALLGYGSEPLTQQSEEVLRTKQNRVMLGRIGFAGFSMMNMMWISIALYTGAIDGQYHNYFLWLSFLLATPTLFYSGLGLLKSSWSALKNKTLNMDTPISIGALTTYCYSSLVLFEVVEGHVYFDTVVNFIFVILIGRYLEASVKKSALIDSSGFESITPKIATLIKSDNTQQLVAVNSLQKGDNILVKSGERIGVDGSIIGGELEVDESIITGEALPIVKKIGDRVFAGTLNNTGSATIIVEKIKNSTIRQIAQLVEDASFSKPHIQCVIDKFIPYFVIATISIAILGFVVNMSLGHSFDFALLAGVSVLIITCPCAFGIAVPMVNSIAGSVLLKNKIIIKNSDALEKLLQVSTVIFDKTGTLTSGEFTVKNITTTTTKEGLLQITASLASLSNHPLATSILKHYSGELLAVQEFSQIAGKGMQGTINGDVYQVGNNEFTTVSLQASNITPNNNTVIYIAKNGHYFGSIGLVDSVHNNAKNVVEFLQQLGKKVVVLSGDNLNAVQKLATELQVDEYYHSQTPQDKLNFATQRQHNENVLMIGDGINDAPVLSAASCSIAIAGIDIASENADVVIHKNNLFSIIKLYKVARLSKSIIMQNIIFALSYNIIFVPLAFFGVITPVIAAIVMPISSIIVILNSIRLKYQHL
jgi:Cu2+-exporting ATPase